MEPTSEELRMSEREIKFRGISKETGEWVFGYYCKVEGKSYIIPDDSKMVQVDYTFVLGVVGFVEVIPETVGQSIGRNDKNGAEIYQGDTVKYGIHSEEITYGIVVWVKLWGMWYINNKNGEGLLNWSCMDSALLASIEVVGNIHQNKELLNG